MIVNVRGCDISYSVKGEGDDLLFLHGWGCPSGNYTVLTDNIARGYRVTCLDFPGFGGSPLPDKAWSIEDYGDAVAEFIEKTGLKNPILAGHSHGGRVILYMCGTGLASPEKIILLGAAGIRPKKTFKKRVRIAAFKTVKAVLCFPLWKGAAAPLLDRARAHFGSADYNSSPPVLRQSMVKLVNCDVTPMLKNIKASTLLIYGENDTDTPVSNARIIERLVPDAGLCIIKGADHFAFAERPAEVNAIINSFLGIK